jgi:hypothetical protein
VSPRAVKNGKKVLEDLLALEQDLSRAAEHKVRLHFVMLD